MEGTGGIASTRLTSAVTATSTTFNVKNTEGGFLKAGILYIGREEVRYVNTTGTTFEIATTGRGYSDTIASAYAVDSMVYTEEASVINGMLGFDIASTSTTAGGINLLLFGWQFLWKSVPKLITWDFAHLRMSEWTLYIRLMLMTMSVGLTFVFFMFIMGAFGGTAQSILRRV